AAAGRDPRRCPDRADDPDPHGPGGRAALRAHHGARAEGGGGGRLARPPGGGHGSGGQLVGSASRTATNSFTTSRAPGASAHHGRSVPSVRRTATLPCAGSSSV